MVSQSGLSQILMPCVVAVYVGLTDLLRSIGSWFVLLYVQDNGDQAANGRPAAGFAAVAEVGVGLAFGPCFCVHIYPK